MNILAFSNQTGSVQWRLDGPAKYINNRTPHEFYVTDSRNWKEDTLGADIVIAQMWRNPKGIDIAHKQGAKVVYEADDIVLGVGGGDRKTLMDLTPEEEEQTKETIAKADLVTVTTEVLADHYRNFNDNVVVLPNYMDFDWWNKPWKPNNTGQLRLGWAGSLSHREDLMFMAPIIKEILDEFPFVKFIYCGAGGKKGIYGEDLFDIIPEHRREYYPGVPLEFWSEKSKSLGIDIGIAPLLDDAFNAGKSNIKYFEYSANGVPGVYADTVVYNTTITNGVNGFLAKTAEEWKNAISKLILDESLREMLATEAQKDIFTNWDIEHHYNKWIEAYERIL